MVTNRDGFDLKREQVFDSLLSQVGGYGSSVYDHWNRGDALGQPERRREDAQSPLSPPGEEIDRIDR